MVQIRVTGMGRATTEPDEAEFAFACQGSGADARGAHAEATAAARALLEQLDALGVPEDRRGVQRTQVHPRTRWVADREVREGWDATVAIDCSIADAHSAFELLEQTAALERVVISGPVWTVLPENAAHDAARHQAVDDGRRKANSYADAAGLVLGDLLELVEGGAAHPAPQMMRGMAMAESTPLEAADQTVSAAVTLVFDAVLS